MRRLHGHVTRPNKRIRKKREDVLNGHKNRSHMGTHALNMRGGIRRKLEVSLSNRNDDNITI